MPLTVVKFLYVKYWNPGISGVLITIRGFTLSYCTRSSYPHSKMTRETKEGVKKARKEKTREEIEKTRKYIG